jgi:hypothetical protein
VSKRQLILHVGCHKTGTSALQKRFLLNRDVLAAASVGLAEPTHPELGDHHFLVSFLEEGPTGYDRFLGGLETGCDTTLVTSECLLPWLLASDRAGDLPAMLAPLFDVTVVLYLRRQDFLKESIFAEVATSWYRGGIGDENHYLYDFEPIVGRLVDLFGAGALRLGIYRDDQRQDIVADFLELCGLHGLAGRLGPASRERVSLDRRKVALLARCPKNDAERFARIREAVVADQQLAPDPCKYQLSPQQRRAFLEPFIESNRRVARAFRPDAEDYLTGAVVVPERWTPPAPYSAVEVARLLTLLAGPTAQDSTRAGAS